MVALADVLETDFEVIAERPGEVVCFTLPSLEKALIQAREFALDGWQCLVIEKGGGPDRLEVIVTSEAA